ncbi:DUF5719 family protein [Georgenia subflava]|uniref:Large extracellular alpha-helical protein n=1 Tax=Georgenia subflava TaxID=1622177 RepID=A0A6N7ELW7_9MICO|nr:DUF5719 family protein [Georgenia subflava]MPV38063.1 hypothetical protein [Georgenia subflava]
MREQEGSAVPEDNAPSEERAHLEGGSAATAPAPEAGTRPEPEAAREPDVEGAESGVVAGPAPATGREPSADAGPQGDEPGAGAEPGPAKTHEPAAVADTGADAETGAEPEEGVAARKQPRGRAAVRRLGATVSALVILAATAGAVLAGEQWSAPVAAATPAGAVDVPAGPVTAVCAGPPTLTTGEGMSVDPEIDPADVVPSTLTRLLTVPRPDAAAAEASYTLLEGATEELTRSGSVRELTLTDPDGAGVLEAQPVDGVSALAGGATLTRTNAGDLRGLSATGCLAPSTTTWLVGGATELGESAQLVLTNAGDTTTTVTATMWTSLGLADAARLSEIVVAPHSQTAILLEGVATGDPALALRVDAAGGEVTATVQDLQLNGLVSAGLDTVSPAAAPALNVTIPGVVLGESTPEDTATSAVRLVNPGEEIATAEVTLLGADGETEIPGAREVVLDPGAVLDLSLAGLEPGAYAVEVDADQPVTGGVVLARTGLAGELDPDAAPVDRAWTAAAEPAPRGLLQTPGLGDLVDAGALVLTNPAEEDVTVELVPVTAGGTIGDPVPVTIPARSTVSTDAGDLAEDLASVVVRPAEDGDDGTGVLGAAVLTATADDGELITVLPLSADPQAARSVLVDIDQ